MMYLKLLLYFIMLPIILIAVFILGIMYGNHIDINTINFNSQITSWITALATLAIAILTIVLATETWRLREIQTEQINKIRKESIKPFVDLYLLSSEASINLMDVHIENTGKGIAKNIKFNFLGKDNKALSTSEEKIINKLLKLNILNKGIASLSPNKKRSSYVFSFPELSGKFKEEVFEANIIVEIHYQDIEGNNYKNIVNLDFSEFIGISEIGGNPLYKIQKDFEKIKEILDSFRGFKHLNVDIYTHKDREQKRKEEEELWFGDEKS